MHRYNTVADVQEFTRILVIRLSSLGDILLTTPVLRVLREHCPAARIDFLTKAAYQDVLRTNPCVDRLGWNTLRAMTPVPEIYMAPLRCLGITAPLPPLEMHLTAESQEALQAYRQQELPESLERPLLAVAPGARWVE